VRQDCSPVVLSLLDVGAALDLTLAELLDAVA
jgi:hypothetical protein